MSVRGSTVGVVGVGLNTHFLDIFEEHTQYFLDFLGLQPVLLFAAFSGGKHPQDYRFQARNIGGPHE